MNKWGRPSKYDYEKFERLLKEYLWKCVDQYHKLLTHKRVDSKWVVHSRYEHKLEANIPTLSWYAYYIWVSRETIYAWTKKYEEFNILIERLQNTQIVRLVNWWLSKRYNGSICCLRLRRLWIWTHRREF